jgi:adenylate cyclase
MAGKAQLTVVSRGPDSRERPPDSTLQERLEGWKQIAAYLHREVRTVQRWEQAEQLPAHRQLHVKLSTVYAFKSELDRWMARRSPSPRSQEMVSLAVRDFTNLGNSQRNNTFSEGIIEDLTTKLSRVEGLRVFPRSATLPFRDSILTAASIGKQLKATHVLEGSVRRDGNRLRINVQLIQTRVGHSLWAQKFDRTVKDVFAIQDEIAESITAALRLRLNAKLRKTARFPSRDVQAYDTYLEARKLIHRFRRKNFQRAKEMFARAVTLDPEFALAHAGLADCCSYLYLYWEPTQENLATSETASLKAVSLDPERAETHASRGISLSTLRNYPEAEREFQTAIDLDPNQFDAHYFYGRAFLAQGKLREAAKMLKDAAALRPEDYQAPALLASTLSGLGLKGDAADKRTIHVARQQLSLNPGDARALYLGAIAWARLGRRRTAQAWAERALALDPNDSAALYNVACLYALLNRKQEALRCLRGVVRSGWRKEWIRNDPDLSRLRNNKEFIDLTR